MSLGTALKFCRPKFWPASTASTREEAGQAQKTVADLTIAKVQLHGTFTEPSALGEVKKDKI